MVRRLQEHRILNGVENISTLGNWSVIEERETELLTLTFELSFEDEDH